MEKRETAEVSSLFSVCFANEVYVYGIVSEESRDEVLTQLSYAAESGHREFFLTTGRMKSERLIIEVVIERQFFIDDLA
jgi:hypothetical protein